ncbi:hypothetical protein BD408DRAFT_412409 [Parasitella parasitica]|nr:hypothetical protein BD408DRAFT_412409 [Parasitella parasitica]
MAGLIQWLLDWLRSLFFKTEMELTLVGLQNSGKTTLVNVIAVISCYSISAKNQVNIDITLQWLIKKGKGQK